MFISAHLSIGNQESYSNGAMNKTYTKNDIQIWGVCDEHTGISWFACPYQVLIAKNVYIGFMLSPRT